MAGLDVSIFVHICLKMLSALILFAWHNKDSAGNLGKQELREYTLPETRNLLFSVIFFLLGSHWISTGTGLQTRDILHRGCHTVSFLAELKLQQHPRELWSFCELESFIDSLFLYAEGVVSELGGPDTERLDTLPDRPCSSRGPGSSPLPHGGIYSGHSEHQPSS